MAETEPSMRARDNKGCNDISRSIEKVSAQSDNLNRKRRVRRYKDTLHLWEFLLELLADENCKSIICWRRKEYGEFKLINQHEVAKRWGLLKQKGDMNYGKLSRALRLYYQEGIIRKVEGQRLVYNFYKLPYKYEPGITRTVYRERFQRINTTLRQEEPLANKSILHEPVSACSASTISATSPTSTPLRKSWSWPVVPMPSPQVCWCPNAVPCLYSPCCSRSRIFYPILSPFRARGVGPTELAFTKKPLVSGVARPSSSLTAV